MNKAIILSSGGIDSTTAMAIAKNQGFEIYSLSFDYGQRHVCELKASQRVARHFGATEHLIVPLEMRMIGGSALTADIDVPKGRPLHEMESHIPVTYVPARNTLFLSYALAWAEVLGIENIFIGVNALDYSGYPDCRPEFIAAFQTMANLATKAGVEGKLNIRIHAPLMQMNKAQIIETGVKLGVDYGLTHSCYDPSADGLACGRCDSCVLRRKGFVDAGMADPTNYAPESR